LLCNGEFEVGATVEEIQAWDPSPTSEEQGNKKRVHAAPGEDLIEEKGRRTWHGREPCVIIARDPEMERKGS
jgi:hypothetical protein